MSIEEEFLPLYEELLQAGPVDALRLAENTGLEPEEADLVLKCIADYLEEQKEKRPMKRPAQSEAKAKQSTGKKKVKVTPVSDQKQGEVTPSSSAGPCAETHLDRQETQEVDTQEMDSPAADNATLDDGSDLPDKSPATTVPGDLPDRDETVKDRSLDRNTFCSCQLRLDMFESPILRTSSNTRAHTGWMCTCPACILFVNLFCPASSLATLLRGQDLLREQSSSVDLSRDDASTLCGP